MATTGDEVGTSLSRPQDAAAPAVLGGSTLCYLVHRLLDFREADAQAAAEINGVSIEKLNMRSLPGDHPFSPFRLIDSPSEAVTLAIAQRAILVKGMFELWGEGSNMAELKESIRRCPAHVMEKWMGEDVSFKFVVDGFGRRFSAPEQVKLMNDLADVCPFKGPVDLKNAQIKLWIIVVNTVEGSGMPPEVPYRMVVAREIEQGSSRSGIQAFSLKKRRYLGPTSMDYELSFLMCNMGHVRQPSLVFDPFAGTGSILVSAAASGAAVIGGDIDPRVIRDGKLDKQGNKCNVYSNFRDYGLTDPAGLLRMDAANPPWRRGALPFLDAVLCDPPYGVRAGGRKMVPRNPEDPVKPKEPDYIPATSAYGLGECLRDLLDTSARLLRVGGRLVYWMPDFNNLAEPSSSNDSASDEPEVLGSIHRNPQDASNGESVPEHPCLTVLNNSIQGLSTRYIRRMITMVKHREYQEEEMAAWKATLGDPALPIDQIHDVVYEARTAADGPEKPTKKRFRGKTH